MFQMTTNNFRALAINALLWFILFLSRLNLKEKLLFFVRLAPHAHCTSIIRRYLFPWRVFRPLIFPALWSFLGRSPAQPTKFDAVWKYAMSAPTSAMILAALCSLI